ARDLILRPSGLDDTRLDVALSQVMSSSVDAADLYFQLSREESWALEDGIVKEGSASIEQGVGVRALAGEKTGFAYSDEIVLPALVQDDKPLALAREAVRQALVNLEAIPAPAGPMTVVLGPGWPGILLHEAIGHGLEGDFNRKGTSAFANRIGERVASELCTIVDDGTLSRRRGSLNLDDEGTPTQCTVLIEKGVLRGYLQDKMNARLTGTASTGNGRRESFAHI